MSNSPDCRKAPISSCFGHHLFMCKKHPTQCYTKFNPCQLCEGDERRQTKADQEKAAQAKALKEQQKDRQREAARQKMGRKMRWTDTQKTGRLTAMRAKLS